MKIEIQNIKLKTEIRNWNLKLKLEIETWNWNLKLKLEKSMLKFKSEI